MFAVKYLSLIFSCVRVSFAINYQLLMTVKIIFMSLNCLKEGK